MEATVEILALPGSLRRGSLNARLLRVAQEHAPAGTTVTVGTLAGVPLFDQDVEDGDGVPPGVAELAAQVVACDALLLATPEYNQSVPGVLKNAIDWLSRRSVGRVLDGLPVGVVGVTPGAWGTRVAQQHLRLVLGATGCHVLPFPQVLVRDGARVLPADGPADPRLVQRVADHVAALGELATRLDRPGPA